MPTDEPDRRCRLCGAHLAADHRHQHEQREWRPRYDDLEGALEGYETVVVARTPIPSDE